MLDFLGFLHIFRGFLPDGWLATELPFLHFDLDDDLFRRFCYVGIAQLVSEASSAFAGMGGRVAVVFYCLSLPSGVNLHVVRLGLSPVVLGGGVDGCAVVGARNDLLARAAWEHRQKFDDGVVAREPDDVHLDVHHPAHPVVAMDNWAGYCGTDR